MKAYIYVARWLALGFVLIISIVVALEFAKFKVINVTKSLSVRPLGFICVLQPLWRDIANSQLRSLSDYKGFAGEFRAIRSGIGGFPIFNQSALHQIGLAFYGPPLQESNARRSSGEDNNEPVGDFSATVNRRGLLAVVMMVVMFVGVYSGSQLFDSGSQMIGRIICGISFGGFMASLILLALSNYRFTWGWWL